MKSHFKFRVTFTHSIVNFDEFAVYQKVWLVFKKFKIDWIKITFFLKVTIKWFLRMSSSYEKAMKQTDIWGQSIQKF